MKTLFFPFFCLAQKSKPTSYAATHSHLNRDTEFQGWWPRADKSHTHILVDNTKQTNMENDGDRPHGPKNHSLPSPTNMCSVQDRPHRFLLVQRLRALFSSIFDPQSVRTPTPILLAGESRRNESEEVNPTLTKTKVLVPIKIEPIPFFGSITASQPDNTPPPIAFEATELRKNRELAAMPVYRTSQIVVPIGLDPMLIGSILLSYIPIIGPIWNWVQDLREFFSEISVSEEIDTPPPMPPEATESRECREVNANPTSRTTKIVAPIKVDPIEWIPVIGSVWEKVKDCAQVLSSLTVTGKIGTSPPVHTANTESGDDEVMLMDSAPKTTNSLFSINVDLTWIHIFVPAWKRFCRWNSFSSSTSLDSRENDAGNTASTPNRIMVSFPISIDLTWIPTFALAWKKISCLAAVFSALSLSVVRVTRIVQNIYELKNTQKL